MSCRNCGKQIRPVKPGEWTHENGDPLCDLEPPRAEPLRRYADERERRDARNADLADKAHNHGNPWTSPELELVRDENLTIAEVAAKTGRSYEATRMKRLQLAGRTTPMRKLAAAVTAAGGVAAVTSDGQLHITGPAGSITLKPEGGKGNSRGGRQEGIARKIAIMTGLSI